MIFSRGIVKVVVSEKDTKYSKENKKGEKVKNMS